MQPFTQTLLEFLITLPIGPVFPPTTVFEIATQLLTVVV